MLNKEILINIFKKLLEEAKKSYDDFLALNDINLSLNSGEYVVLLGPNGAGKSTLFSILTGMLSPDLGDCIINGYSIKSQNVNAFRYIERFQYHVHYSTIISNDYKHIFRNVSLVSSQI